MAMIKIELELFDYEELEETAQQKAFEEWSARQDYSWSDDNLASLKEFEKLFPVDVENWEYGYHNHITFICRIESEHENLKGIRLLKHIQNEYMNLLEKPKYLKHVKGKAYYSKVQKTIDCPFTGYCMDHVLIDPLLKFLKNPDQHCTFQDVLRDCLNNWVIECDRDYQQSISLEFFEQETKENDFKYEKNGNFRRL